MVKAPMILITYSCGVLTGVNLVGFTFIGELLQSGTFLDAALLIVFLVILIIVCPVILLFILNLIMARYDQLDVLPIYQSFNMCISIIMGFLILGEAERYSTGHIIGVCFGMLVVAAGIMILGYKKTAIETDSKKKDENGVEDRELMINLVEVTDEDGTSETV